jgi:hypothetical protein
MTPVLRYSEEPDSGAENKAAKASFLVVSFAVSIKISLSFRQFGGIFLRCPMRLNLSILPIAAR